MIGDESRYILLKTKSMLSRLLGKPVCPDFRVNSIDFRVNYRRARESMVVYLWGVNKQPDRQEDNPSDNYEVQVPDNTIFVCLERTCTSRRTSKR